MNHLRRIYPPFQSGAAAVGLLLVRLIVGAAFLYHGAALWHSPAGPSHWMGPHATMPPLLQLLPVLAQLLGGLGLVLGALSPVTGLALILTMLGAIMAVHLPHGEPFLAPPGKHSFELAAAYLGVALVILTVGPGTLSLDYLVLGRYRR